MGSGQTSPRRQAHRRADCAASPGQLLAQAISNLVENAIRYGSSGGAIEIVVERADGKVQIAVADHGPGIPAELRSEARKRFGRLDASRTDEGAGLGLALAEAIAHLHDGQLRLEDNLPGLLSMLELPFHSGEATPGEAKARRSATSPA